MHYELLISVLPDPLSRYAARSSGGPGDRIGAREAGLTGIPAGALRCKISDDYLIGSSGHRTGRLRRRRPAAIVQRADPLAILARRSPGRINLLRHR